MDRQKRRTNILHTENPESPKDGETISKIQRSGESAKFAEERRLEKIILFGYRYSTKQQETIRKMLSIKVNKKQGYLEMATRENNIVVEVTSVNNGYMVRSSSSGDIWVYDDVDDALKQARELLESAYEDDK